MGEVHVVTDERDERLGDNLVEINAQLRDFLKTEQTRVTYKALIPILTGITTGICSIMWVGWQVHASHPHPGAATQREFERQREDLLNIQEEFKAHRKYLVERLDRIEEIISQRNK